MTAGNDENRRLESALASLDDIKGDGDGCPSAERIWESAAGRLASADDQAVVFHLGECGCCSAAWRIADELARGATPAEVTTRSSWPRGLPLLVAASIVIAAVGVGVYRYLRTEDLQPVYRQQQEEWLEAATTTAPRDFCTLRWTAGPEGTTYDLLVMDADLQLLDRARALDLPEFTMASGDLDSIPQGGTILWRVTAHLPDGRRVVSRTFTTHVE